MRNLELREACLDAGEFRKGDLHVLQGSVIFCEALFIPFLFLHHLIRFFMSLGLFSFTALRRVLIFATAARGGRFFPEKWVRVLRGGDLSSLAEKGEPLLQFRT